MEITKIRVKGVEHDIKDERARGLVVGLASEQYVNDAIANAKLGSEDAVEVLDYSTIQDTDFNLSPNKVYVLGTKDSLNITFLAPADETKGAIYNFSFTAGDAVTTPIFYRGNGETPIAIDKGNLEFVAGNKYEVSYNWASGILIAQ